MSGESPMDNNSSDMDTDTRSDADMDSQSCPEPVLPVIKEIDDDCDHYDWVAKFSKLPQSVQNDALADLITMCTYSQIRHLQFVIAPYFQKDFINLLPKELSLRILSYLSPEDLVQAAKVSRYWRKISEDELLWLEKCRRHEIREIFPPTFGRREVWFTLQNTSNHSPFCDNAISSLINQSIPLNPTEDIFTKAALLAESGLPTCLKRSRPKAICLRNKRIFNNWCNRRPTAVCELRGHDEHVITCLQLRDDLVVTGSDDQTIRVWSTATALCRHILTGHTGGVWALQLSEDGKTIVSGSTDRTVRVWDTETGSSKFCLVGHTSTVRCMALHGKILVTGSRDCTLRIWDFEEGHFLRTLFGHMAAVRCVQFDGRTVVSGAYDANLIVWDANTGHQVHLLEGHTTRVYSLLFDSALGLVASGSLDTTIKIWSTRTGQCLQTLVGHASLTSGMQFIPENNRLVSANADCTIKVWDIATGQCIHTLAGQNRHASAVTSLQYFKGMVVSGGDDGVVKLWDIKRGTFICDLLRFGATGSGCCVWKVKATPTLLVCAVGSRNQTEDTRLVLMDFDAPYP